MLEAVKEENNNKKEEIIDFIDATSEKNFKYYQNKFDHNRFMNVDFSI